MECQKLGCKESGQIECLVHKMKYCFRHYDEHKREGGEEERKIILRLKGIEEKCWEYQKQIIELSGNMIKFIQRAAEISLKKVNELRAILEEAILRGEELGDGIEKGFTFTVKDNKVFRVNAQELMNFSEFRAFEALVKSVKQKQEEKKDFSERRENPEKFSVNDLDLNKKIAWIKGGGFDLSLIDRIDDIKVTKTREFVIVCTIYIVSKENIGKFYIDSIVY